ncbi:hypothetical protein CR205_10470 [Alteribacter lacisalsi]|uniref:Uncharacterized protein n=1 Tax=Alteribacter lacisalsi TaxID=2045244 RepID=A0A2W0HDJ5_9BACI|nr:hypothetical protein [Alteribacter lacisalsi]PYZ98966.1 hypothetical protein CR205_10470 [Alteribacter lacisalsi]
MRYSHWAAAACLGLVVMIYAITFTIPQVSTPFTDVPLWLINLVLSPIGMIFSSITLNRCMKRGLPLMIGNLVSFPGIIIFLVAVTESVMKGLL